MNTTPTQFGSDTALSQTKGRKADVSNKVSTRLPLCKYILHLVVHTWEQPFFNAVGTSQSAQFRPISNCHAKHWWTKQERSYDLPPQSNVSHVNHRWTKLPSSVLQIMKPPVSIFLLLVVVSCKDTTFFEITTHLSVNLLLIFEYPFWIISINQCIQQKNTIDNILTNRDYPLMQWKMDSYFVQLYDN